VKFKVEQVEMKSQSEMAKKVSTAAKLPRQLAISTRTNWVIFEAVGI
jgi:hypothetical protein